MVYGNRPRAAEAAPKVLLAIGGKNVQRASSPITARPVGYHSLVNSVQDCVVMCECGQVPCQQRPNALLARRNIEKAQRRRHASRHRASVHCAAPQACTSRTISCLKPRDNGLHTSMPAILPHFPFPHHDLIAGADQHCPVSLLSDPMPSTKGRTSTAHKSAPKAVC